MDISIIALGHTPSDTSAVLEPTAQFVPGARFEPDAPRPGLRTLVFTQRGWPRACSVADAGAGTDPSLLLPGEGAQQQQQQAPATAAVLYVADLGPYDQAAPATRPTTTTTTTTTTATPENHIQSLIADFAALRARCRALGLPMVVALRGVGRFRARLAASPLGDCLPGYSWLDDPGSAADLGAPPGLDAVVRRMMMMAGDGRDGGRDGDKTVHFHFVDADRAGEHDVRVILSALEEILGWN